jgi:hypothetical protein
LANFADALGSASGREEEPPQNWSQAFMRLRKHLESLRRRRKKRVVFLDELPWLASRRSRFLPALEHFWNSWASRRGDFVFVICGSAAAWMVRKVIDARGGLHNRVTRRLRLEPFDLSETEKFRKDAAVNLCEMKFSESEFVVDKRYADELRRKRDVFRSVTGTRKSVFITLVTTFGVSDNKHRRAVIDVVIEMDALFASS